MSTSSGDGAALDATGVSVEPSEHDELRVELAALTEQMTDEERTREARRVEISHKLYEQASRVEGTTTHAAHVAQLRRLRDEAADAVTGANLALEKAREHAAGKEDAVREAESALNSAEAALAEFEPDDDGSAVL